MMDDKEPKFIKFMILYPIWTNLIDKRKPPFFSLSLLLKNLLLCNDWTEKKVEMYPVYISMFYNWNKPWSWIYGWIFLFSFLLTVILVLKSLENGDSW